MALLPEKNLLDGSKKPVTSTGEMKDALGKLRDYLAELFGDDSSGKEKARQTPGIDLSALSAKSDIEAALSEKADKAELENKASQNEIEVLEEEIAKRGIPVGSIDYFASATPPAGYLKADGSEVRRQTYPELFTAIGTTFGNGDGVTTFNLPDLMDRFPEGNTIPGIKRAAGLPNITGSTGANSHNDLVPVDGAFKRLETTHVVSYDGSDFPHDVYFDASLANAIYGASGTVQPPALTLLPCIKAFDSVINPGLIDITELANETAGKLEKTIDGTSVNYIADTFYDGTNWWRQWSDGWLEQGGIS